MSMLAEDFLLAMQKLVLGNSLNTTYKLALILAVTNKAGEIEFVNQPDATHFTISYSEIAREFLRIYWPQARRYERSEENSVESTVLYQSTNPGNAVVITLIRDFQQANTTGDLENLTFLQAQALPGFETLLQECLTRVVKKNPLHYIQGHEFLFEKDDAVDMIRLERNTAVFLCRFQPIIQELIFSRWEKLLRSIKKNAVFLGESSERSLREFLFFPQRTNEALATVKKVLREATRANTCFYCGAPLNSSCHADHFLPYTRFAHTRTFNFVLACGRCNCSKNDRLAGADHLFHWADRNERFAREIIECSRDRLEAGTVLVPEMAVQQYEHAATREHLWVRAIDGGSPETKFLTGIEAERVMNRLVDHARSMARYV